MKGGTRVTNADILRIYASHTWPYAPMVFIMLVGLLFSNATEIILPTVYKIFFDTLTRTPQGVETIDTLRTLVFAILGIHVIGWMFYRFASFLNNLFQSRVMKDLEQTSFAYLIRHSFHFFSNAFAGALVRKVNRLPRAFESFIEAILWRLLPLAMTIIGTLLVLGWRDGRLALVMGVWTLLFITFNGAVSAWKLRYDVIRAARESEATGALADSLSNSLTVKLFAAEKREEEIFGQANESLRRIRTWSWNILEANNTIQHLFMIVAEVAIFLICISFWEEGHLTLGDFVMIQGVFMNLTMKLWDVGRVIRDVYESFADAKEMAEILQTPYDVKDTPRAKSLAVTKGQIAFKNVTFRYGENRSVLSNFSLTIKPREKIAFVGPSGAGKSTIVRLLLRLYDITDGTIEIDGQSISKATQKSLREAIAVVPQESILFHRSIMENIRYGRPGATDAEVIAAAQAARCHEFIMELTEGYDTFVGERGVKLSGGERPRVAIARAILKDAPILLLDEATASLDSESEALIQEALQELMKKKTAIVVAHRLSTIMQMDRIVVIEGGSVAASGTHKELLRKKGTYKTLWNIQAGGFLP